MRRHGLSLALCFLAALPSAAGSAPKEHYHCPYLSDPERQTLAPMTQGKDGWFFRAADFIEQFILMPEAETYLRRLNSAFAERGERLIILAVPPRILAAPDALDPAQPMQDLFELSVAQESYRHYLEALRKTGITIAAAFDRAGQKDAESGMAFFFRRDQHWTPFGAKLAAAQVAFHIRKDPEYAKRMPAQYRTIKENELLTVKGEMVQEIRSLCTDVVPAERYPEYRTVKEQEKNAEALFGDEEASPAIVLLGSSFSEGAGYNLDGFLSQESGLDVANFAISAGQLYNAIISYVSLPEARKLQPRYIVWETLAHYDFNHGERMFRQIIPAVAGECGTEEAVAVKKLEVRQGKGGEIFTLNPEQDISGSGYYLFLSTNNLGLARLTLEMDYADGDGEWFPVDRTENFNNTGRFFVELSDELTAPLTRIAVDGLPDVNATLEVRLCRSSAGKE